MAGNPMRRAFYKRLAEFGGIERVLELIEDGRTVSSIAGELGYSRFFLSRELNRPEVEGAYRLAQSRAAHAFADEALDEARTITPETANAAKQKMDALRWAAKVRDPETYGEKHGPAVQVNVQTLALDALRKRAVDITPQIEATKEIEGAD
jgi:hypothetical protein